MKKKHKHHKNPQIQAKCADFWGERMKKKKKTATAIATNVQCMH